GRRFGTGAVEHRVRQLGADPEGSACRAAGPEETGAGILPARAGTLEDGGSAEEDAGKPGEERRDDVGIGAAEARTRIRRCQPGFSAPATGVQRGSGAAAQGGV